MAAIRADGNDKSDAFITPGKIAGRCLGNGS
jgi:hypothetical protein